MIESKKSDSWDAKLLLFIKRGNFETLYPKVFQKHLIKNKLENLLKSEVAGEKNLNEIFDSLKRVQIPMTFFDPHFSIETIDEEQSKRFLDLLLRSTDKNKLEWFAQQMTRCSFKYDYAMMKQVRPIIFEMGSRNRETENTWVALLINLIESSTKSFITHYLIAAGLISLAIEYITVTNNTKDLKILRKYLHESAIFRHTLLTYNSEIIDKVTPLLNKTIQFNEKQPWKMRHKIHDFLGEFTQALMWIDDPKFEEAYIKEKDLYEEAIAFCVFKERSKSEPELNNKYMKYLDVLEIEREPGFYLLYFADNTNNPSKALDLSIEARNVDYALKYALKVLSSDALINLHYIDQNKCTTSIIKEAAEEFETKERWSDAGDLYLCVGDIGRSVTCKLAGKRYAEVIELLELDYESIEARLGISESEMWKGMTSTVDFKTKIHRSLSNIHSSEIVKLHEFEIDLAKQALVTVVLQDWEENKEHIDTLIESYDKNLKKYDALKDFVDCDEMTVSSVSSLSQLRGLRGLKKRVKRLQLKERELIDKFAIMGLQYFEKLENERAELEKYKEVFKGFEERCEEILQMDEQEICLIQ